MEPFEVDGIRYTPPPERYPLLRLIDDHPDHCCVDGQPPSHAKARTSWTPAMAEASR